MTPLQIILGSALGFVIAHVVIDVAYWLLFGRRETHAEIAQSTRLAELQAKTRAAAEFTHKLFMEDYGDLDDVRFILAELADATDTLAAELAAS